ncbi:putative transmembrane protein [Toxoplasma gondii p89]|uniref:Putative transmembrane protein n=1 Tax=Toxoplasma gondii p89 TaxID=943119 RepID=A0A086K4I5_TOXGO|nr:putative transmembrane protein [Toxoplasma gondii p89]
MRKRQWRRKGIAARPFSGNSGLSYDSSQMETGRPREKMQTHRRACSTGQLLGLFSAHFLLLREHGNSTVALSFSDRNRVTADSTRCTQSAGKVGMPHVSIQNAYLHSYVRVCMKSNTRIRMVFYCRITHFFMQSGCLPSI